MARGTTIPHDSVFLYLADQLKTVSPTALATATVSDRFFPPIHAAEQPPTTTNRETAIPNISSLFPRQQCGPSLSWLNA